MADELNLGNFSRSVRKIYCQEDTRSHIEHDEDSITSGGASLEEHSVEHTCTFPSSPSTDELKIMRNQGAIPKNFRKVLPPGPEPSPKEVSLEKCKEDGRKEDPSTTYSVKLPETDDDIQKAVEQCKNLISSLKNKRRPVDFSVILDSSKIKHVEGKYEENSEFFRTGELKKRNKAGAVYKVKDNQTHEEHCLKIVRLSSFNVQELQCLVDLRHTCYVPKLLMFRIRDDAVELHMEIVRNAFTMEQVIQEKVCELGDLGKPFAYYILREMLMAMSVMQEKKWLHGDIHDKNIMMQLLGSENLALNLIDFGDAFQIKNAEEDETNLTCEIKMVMSIFTAVFDMICFNDEDDRRESLDHEKKEVLDLVAFAVDTKNPFQSEELFKRVENQFNESLKDLDMTKAEFLRKVVAVLSTEKSDDGAKAREDWEEDIKSPEGNMATLHGEEGDRNTKFPEDGNSSAPLPKPAL